VEHVHERVQGCPGVERVIIATDSLEVQDACRSFGAEVAMTSADHVSGTDRVAEVAGSLPHDIVINVQGDEPLIEHDDLLRLRDLFQADVSMTTLAASRRDPEGFADPNIVKAVVAEDGHALYFSRSPVPYAAPGAREVEWLQHIGVYGYRREFLLRLSRLPPTALEKRERLEQLRALENGFRIRVGITPHRHLGIDTEEEYRRFAGEYLRGSPKE